MSGVDDGVSRAENTGEEVQEQEAPMGREEMQLEIRRMGLWMTQVDGTMLQLMREMKTLGEAIKDMNAERPSPSQKDEEDFSPVPPPRDNQGWVTGPTRQAGGPSARSVEGQGPEREYRYDTYGGYDMKTVHRLYSDSLRNTKVAKVPDFKFETAYMTWHRLLADIPIPVDRQRALMALAFEGVALKVFEQTAALSARLHESPEQLWQRLREKLCNKSHIISLRSQLMNVKWDEKRESVAQYANRLRTMSMNLPEDISDDMMINMFTQGLPNRLRIQALAVQGSFDEVVSRTALIASETGLGKESMRPITEGSKGGNSSKYGNSSKSSGVNESKQYCPPSQQESKGGHNQVGNYRPRQGAFEIICYYCRKPGHIIRDCRERIVNERRLRERQAQQDQARGQGNDKEGPANQ